LAFIKPTGNMEPITADLIARIDSYIEQLFVPRDVTLTQGLADAEAAGLPAINVSPNQGKLLYLLARMSSARRILEVGTLGGYSTTWLARALPRDGVIVTLELNQRNADVARRNLERSVNGVAVDLRVGAAADTLRRMIAAREEPFDLVFIDADKPGYVTYLELALELSRPGTVILADNLVRHGHVLEDAPEDENARAAKAYNALIASHPRLESIIVPLARDSVDGMSISIVRAQGVGRRG
jgi:predicted O-methyltransferase YrrM